jgi:hypothetical protein
MAKFVEPQDVRLKQPAIESDLFEAEPAPSPKWAPIDDALPAEYPYDGQPVWVREATGAPPVEAVLKRSREFSRVTARFENTAFWADRAGKRRVSFTPLEFLPHGEAVK